MSKPKFLSTLHEDDLESLTKAAEDVGLAADLMIVENARDHYGNLLEGYVAIWTKAPEKDHEKLWRRYEFHHAWQNSDVDTEIEALTHKFSKPLNGI